MKLYKALICLAGLGTFFLAQASGAVAISGNPLADSWTSHGNSLSNGVYVKSGGNAQDGYANYGYDTYSASFQVKTKIGSGQYAWNTNDTVIGVGGIFHTITFGDADWSTGSNFSGDPVNARLPTDNKGYAPKLQVKFGTSNASWQASTKAPSPGNGNSSSSSGGGRVQVRTSAYFSDLYLQQNENTLFIPRKANPDNDNLHVLWDVGGSSELNPYQAARMIWDWDDDNSRLSWEFLLNVTLLDDLAPDGFSGILPKPGDPAILTVQDRDTGYYTDSLIQTSLLSEGGEGTTIPVSYSLPLPTTNNVPAPGALWLFAGGLLGLLAASRRRLTR